MMHVGDVQRYLESLIDLLAAAGGKGVGADLEHLRAGLEPFRHLGLNEFGDVLRRAAAGPEAGGTGKRSAKSRSKIKMDLDLVRQTLREVEDLYERAKNPDAVGHEVIGDEVKRWDKALNKEEGFEVSRAFLGADCSYPSKIAALEAVGRKIADRLTAQKRIANLDRTHSVSEPPTDGGAGPHSPG